MFKIGVGHPVTIEDKEALLKELCDLQYVLSGTVISFGFKEIFQPAFNRVHESVMSKIYDGMEKRGDGKVLKGPHYKPANLRELFEE